MNPYKNNGTRNAAHLHHPVFGVMEFAWDSSDWTVVCFHGTNPAVTPCVSVGFHTFQSSKPMTVEKIAARRLWNALAAHGRDWKTQEYPA